MGSKSSKQETITTHYKKDTFIKTVLKTENYRIGFQMKADREESRNLQTMWKDFITGARNTFTYNNATKYPQQIKFIRLNDGSLQFTTSTTVNIKEEELESFTRMFDTISKNIDTYNKSVSTGLTVIDNSSSSNLLVFD
jgi:hypothetical protein